MIPKKIHYFWVGGNPLPESAKKCIKSWQKYCPDYEIIEWNESNYDFTKIPYMKEAYDAKKWGFVPDYARLDIIYQYGGIYLDTDVELVKSYDDFLELPGFAGFESEVLVNFGQGFGAEAGNPVIKHVRDNYESLHFINGDGSLNLIASPKVNTDALIELGLKHNGDRQEIGDFVIFPVDYLCPKSLDDGIIRKTKNTHSIHHFDASWFSEDKQKEKEERWKRKKKAYIKRNIRNKTGNAVDKILGKNLSNKIKTTLGLKTKD